MDKGNVMSDSREAFEKWAAHNMKNFAGGLNLSLVTPSGHDGWTYATKAAESSWMAWQASRQAIPSCSENPNSSDPAKEAKGRIEGDKSGYGRIADPALEGEPAAVINKSAAGDYEFFPAPGAASIPNGIHKLYTHPASAHRLTLGQRKAEQIGPTIGVLVQNQEGRVCAVTDMGRCTWLSEDVTGAGDGASVPDNEYISVLQDAFDIIQADANTEENYRSMCRIGAVLVKLMAAPVNADVHTHICRFSRAMDGACMVCGSKQEQGQ